MKTETTEKEQLFYLVYQDTSHKSDHMSIVMAADPQHAREKANFHLRNKDCDYGTLQILTEKEFKKSFSKKQPFYFFYQNCTGQRFCRVLGANITAAKKIFSQRFPTAEVINTMDQQQFQTRNLIEKPGRETQRKIHLPKIIFTPYLPETAEAVNQ